MSESPPLLEARALGKSFEGPSGRIEVLASVNLSVVAGESVSIRGESGAGKTTLLNLLAGLERPSSGSVYWQGEAIERRSAAWLARQRCRQIGLVFQSYYLMPELNAEENVLLPARMFGALTEERRERARELLRQVGLGERLRQRPAKLSGGERQRVAIARALINRPALLLADEPTGNLDEHTAEGVMQTFLRLVADERVSLILVTHNPAFAAQTARQLVLREGGLDVAASFRLPAPAADVSQTQ
ncbi:MAG: ABC transporter ATP-binding protein [Opitutales bacterium]